MRGAMSFARCRVAAMRWGLAAFVLATGVGDRLQGAGASNLVFGTPAQGYQIRARINTHTDARWVENYEPVATDTLLFRRLSLNMEATLVDKFTLRVMPDFSASTVNVLDAYVAYRASPAFAVLTGKTKSPFDLERLVSQTDLLFVERAYPTSLAPNRDVGLQVFGEVAARKFAYQIGWVNGVRDGDSAELSHIRPREWVVRGFAQPFRLRQHSPLQGLGVGAALSVDTKSAVAPAGYRTLAQQRFLTWRSDIIHDGSHRRIEPQAFYYAGRIGLVASWVASRAMLISAARALRQTLTQKAWYVAGHWMITGEMAVYRDVVPTRTFGWSAGAPGALELTARLSELAIDDAAFPNFVSPVNSWRRARTATAGLNWHLNAHVKAVLNLERTLLRGSLTGANRASGNAVLARVQLRY